MSVYVLIVRPSWWNLQFTLGYTQKDRMPVHFGVCSKTRWSAEHVQAFTVDDDTHYDHFDNYNTLNWAEKLNEKLKDRWQGKLLRMDMVKEA